VEDLVDSTLGKYEIIEEIGRGGMAVVYKAFQPRLKRHVALKVLPPWLALDESFVARFQQEAIAAGNLNHTNIVTIHDVEEEHGLHFIVMQYLEGRPLSKLLRKHKPLALTRVLSITQQVAGALDYAHGHGFVHRDIKPANIIIGPDDHATVTDFGLVKAAGGLSMTGTSTLVGTPHYMSPEQCAGGEAGRRSDIYSLGVVVYEMLTGRAPFGGANLASILYKHVHEKPPSPRKINPELPRDIESVLFRALAKEPRERYGTAVQFLGGLEGALFLKASQEARVEPGAPLPVAEVSETPAGPPESTPTSVDTQDGQRLRTLRGHSGWVRTAAFSPDGATLASGSDDNTLILWDVETGDQLRTLEGHTGVLYSVAFSPDGATLASGSWDNTVILWDVASGRRLRTLEGHQAGVNSVTFSPNGAALASGSDDRTVILWHVRTGQQVRTLEDHTGVVYGVAFSPDGQTLATGSWDRTVILWDVRNLEPVHTLERHAGPLLGMAFSPDSATLASGSSEGLVILWNVGRGRRDRTLKGHTDGVRSVAFSPDGVTLASGSDDRTVVLWDVESGDRLTPLKGHRELVTAVAFSPDGHTLASGSFDRTLILWHVEHRETPRKSRMLRMFGARRWRT
jgi:WD40 repeat protein/predicted Ser/Thr protein kinase